MLPVAPPRVSEQNGNDVAIKQCTRKILNGIENSVPRSLFHVSVAVSRVFFFLFTHSIFICSLIAGHKIFARQIHKTRNYYYL